MLRCVSIYVAVTPIVTLLLGRPGADAVTGDRARRLAGLDVGQAATLKCPAFRRLKRIVIGVVGTVDSDDIAGSCVHRS